MSKYIYHMSLDARKLDFVAGEKQRHRPANASARSDQSLCKSLAYSVSVKLLTEHHLELLRLKVGCTG